MGTTDRKEPRTDFRGRPEKRPSPPKTRLALVPAKSAGGRKLTHHLVAQLRLARIEQIQADIAYLQMELFKEWQSVRAEIMGGAGVEQGPLRAWLRTTLRMVRDKATRKKEWRVSRT